VMIGYRGSSTAKTAAALYVLFLSKAIAVATGSPGCSEQHAP
jgi:hypothetical protein